MAERELIPGDRQRKCLEIGAQNPGVGSLHLPYSCCTSCDHLVVEGQVSEFLVFRYDETMAGV